MNLEKQILGEILYGTYEEQFEAFNDCGVKYFTEERNRLLFTCFGNVLLRGVPLEMSSAYHECKSKIEDFDVAELTDLQSKVFSNAYLSNHIQQLKENFYVKELIELSDGRLKELKKTTNAVDADIVKDSLIAELSVKNMNVESKFVDFDKQTEHIDKNLSKDSRIEGYSWGIHDLDVFTSGLVVPRLIVVGALKKSGKTRFVVQIRKNLANQGIYSPFLSLEMPEYELTKLHYSCFTEINDMKFRSKSMMSNEEKQIYLQAKGTIPFHLIPTECVSGLAVEQVIGRIRKFSRLYPKCVIFIDYLQRIKHDRNRQAFELEDISNKIADATRLYDVNVVLLSQLQNLAEREIPSIGSLKGCVEENTLIDGKPIKEYYFENLKKDISSFDTETKTHEKRVPSEIIDSGVKQCYEILTKSGKKIIVSGTTKLYTNKEKWEDVADIKVGDKIVVATD